MKSKFGLYDQQGFNQSQTLVREKKSKQTKKTLRLLLLFCLLLFGLVLVSKLPGWVSGFSKPFNNVQSDLVNYNKIDSNFRTNILLIGEKDKQLQELALASLDPTDKRVNVLSLSAGQKIFGSNKDYTFRNVYQIKLNGAFSLDPLVAKVMENLGYPVDGYLIVNESKTFINQASLESLFNNLYSFKFFLGILSTKNYLDRNIKTNLSLGDLYTLTSKVKSLSPDRVNFIDLTKNTDEAGYFDQKQLTNKIGVIMEDSRLASENITVRVVNASGVAGVGNIFRNLLTNLGVNVIELSIGATTGQSKVSFSKRTSLVTRLDNLFKEKFKESNNNRIGVDEEVIIGQNLAKYFDF